MKRIKYTYPKLKRAIEEREEIGVIEEIEEYEGEIDEPLEVKRLKKKKKINVLVPNISPLIASSGGKLKVKIFNAAGKRINYRPKFFKEITRYLNVKTLQKKRNISYKEALVREKIGDKAMMKIFKKQEKEKQEKITKIKPKKVILQEEIPEEEKGWVEERGKELKRKKIQRGRIYSEEVQKAQREAVDRKRAGLTRFQNREIREQFTKERTGARERKKIQRKKRVIKRALDTPVTPKEIPKEKQVQGGAIILFEKDRKNMTRQQWKNYKKQLRKKGKKKKEVKEKGPVIMEEMETPLDYISFDERPKPMEREKRRRQTRLAKKRRDEITWIEMRKHVKKGKKTKKNKEDKK